MWHPKREVEAFEAFCRISTESAERNTLEAVVDLQRSADAHTQRAPLHPPTYKSTERGLGRKSDARRASLIDK